jgi:predicted MFS family arabinose efflux permease
MPVFIGTMTIMGTLPMWYLVKADIKSHYIFSFVNALLAGFLSSTVGPNVRAMIMNVNEPETRGLALAFQTTLDDLGKGLGPAVVAIMISTLGRESAFFWATAGWIPCGALLLMTAFTLEGDEQAMQSRLKARMSLAATGSELEVFE